MTEEQKRKIEQKLWDIANTLRGKIDADEFRDYILGFIFYKCLSEKLNSAKFCVLPVHHNQVDLNQFFQSASALELGCARIDIASGCTR